ncbi:MAG: hypothetical protein FWC67_01245, partial [Defluviitaleaceae bacterium]|nr:hypothetical protein [Defluviitaleaceae bacterium]
MNDTFKEKAIEILKFFTNRLFILAAVLTVSFGVLVVNLFERQIVYGDYSPPQVWTFERVRPYNAPRGEIFDVNGRPLAVNIPVFVVMLDPTEVFTVAAAHDSLDLNQAFLLFMEIMARNDEEMHIDAEFIISDTVPRVFTVTSESTQRRWKYDLLINVDYDAPQAYEALMA